MFWEHDVVRANNPTLLKDSGGDVMLTGKWPRGVLGKLKWNKRKSTTGNADPSPQFLTKEKFSFQRNISALVTEHDIRPCLIINIDETPLSYVNTRKYMLSFKGAKNVPTSGMNDRLQITATFTASCTGDFLLIQLIYSGTTK